MKLVEQLISKMLTLHEEFSIRGYELKSVWAFYKCYNIALAVLGIEDEEIYYKNRLWKKIIWTQIEKDTFSPKAYEKLQREIKKDTAVVLDALREIVKENESLGFNKGNLWKPKILGVQYFDFESEYK